VAPRLVLAAAVAALAGLTAPGARAQSASYVTPHWDATAGATSVTLGGETLVNHGLVGVGQLSAATRDFNNGTLGSFSGMSLDVAQWRRQPDGRALSD
jgi:hypothetical protein